MGKTTAQYLVTEPDGQLWIETDHLISPLTAAYEGYSLLWPKKYERKAFIRIEDAIDFLSEMPAFGDEAEKKSRLIQILQGRALQHYAGTLRGSDALH